jgi:chaperonin cofactor prefoldin
MVISAVLALLFGGAGAWAYERFLSRPAAVNPPTASESQGRDSEIRKDLAGLDDRIKELSNRFNNLADQYKPLQSRLESMPKSAPTPDLAPIEQKVALVDRLSQQVDAIAKKVDPLPQKLEQYERRLTEIDAKLEDLRKEEPAARGRTPRSRDRPVSSTGGDRPSASTGGDRPSPSTGGDRPSPIAGAESKPSASDDKGQSLDSALASGVSLFREKRYGEAYAVFRGLLQSRPDDARVWYYAALSYGLATGDWGRVAETMAQEGVAREKAGKPPKSEIDAAFAGLTKETGKDWLDFFRRRAR